MFPERAMLRYPVHHPTRDNAFARLQHRGDSVALADTRHAVRSILECQHTATKAAALTGLSTTPAGPPIDSPMR